MISNLFSLFHSKKKKSPCFMQGDFPLIKPSIYRASGKRVFLESINMSVMKEKEGAGLLTRLQLHNMENSL